MPPVRPTRFTLAPPPSDASPGSHLVRVPAGELTVAARDGVTLASEADSLVLTAATEIVLNVGRSTLTLRADGTILLNGRRMTLLAPEMIDLNPDVGSEAGDAAARSAAARSEAARSEAARPCGCAGPPATPQSAPGAGSPDGSA